jgi:RNA polymerase sigma factor (sigma-70 family)
LIFDHKKKQITLILTCKCENGGFDEFIFSLYGKATREYIGTRAILKELQMESFDQLSKQYKPMIHRIIHSLGIYKNIDEFYQVGLIGLWDAAECFKAEKGDFTNYAYSYIKGRILNELSKNSKHEERTVYPKEEYWETVEDTHFDQSFEKEFLLSFCDGLTDRETRWVLDTFYNCLTVREIAKKEGVSVSAVKQWRKGAVKKLEGNLKKLINY